MDRYILDWTKMDQFYEDKKKLDWRQLWDKYKTIANYRPAYMSNLLHSEHMVYTLVAHSHGRIHARRMVRDTRWEEPNEKHHSWKALSRTYKIEINTLEEQAKFLGPWLEFFQYRPDMTVSAPRPSQPAYQASPGTSEALAGS